MPECVWIDGNTVKIVDELYHLLGGKLYHLTLVPEAQAGDLIEGVTVRLGKRDFVVPAMTLPLVKRYITSVEELQKNKEVPIDAFWDLQYKTILAAMKRNYPELTLDELYELLDMNNLLDVFKAIAGKSGLILGEAVGGALQRLVRSTGTDSTRTLPQAPDGAGGKLTN